LWTPVLSLYYYYSFANSATSLLYFAYYTSLVFSVLAMLSKVSFKFYSLVTNEAAVYLIASINEAWVSSYLF